MSTSSLIKSLDYFFVLRPVLFVPGWSTLLAGYLIASKNTLFFEADDILNHNYIEISILLILFSCAMGASFLLNQMRDVESDLKNNKLFFLSEKHISKKVAIVEIILLISTAIILAFSFNILVVIDTVLFIIITGYLYNFEPFNLKDKPWGSVAANSAMGFLAFAIGWHSLQEYTGSVWVDVLPYLFFNTALYFYTILPDVPGDKNSNKLTLAVIKGEKFVINISTLCFVVAIILTFILKDSFALFFILVTFPFSLYAFIKKEISSTIRATKFGIFFFSVVICLKLPHYFILLLTVFIMTKWYFKIRFQYNYPNFKGQ